MKQKEVPEMDAVEEIISKISEDSPYKRRPTQKRTWMTVPEMGKLLGLKKTDRYWLVHKNVFESKEIAGKIRINIASFEKWYTNQIKYHKVTGEEPGKELKSWSYRFCFILSCKSLFLCFVFCFCILIGCPVTGFTFFIEYRLFYRYFYDFLMCPGIIPFLC